MGGVKCHADSEGQCVTTSGTHAHLAGVYGRYQGAPETAQQLSEELQDVPQATLYRHLNKLEHAGVLVVAEERQVREPSSKCTSCRRTQRTLARRSWRS